MPLILNSLDNLESARRCLITEPPWLPVAPKTVMSFDMFERNDIAIENGDPRLDIVENGSGYRALQWLAWIV